MLKKTMVIANVSRITMTIDSGVKAYHFKKRTQLISYISTKFELANDVAEKR